MCTILTFSALIKTERHTGSFSLGTPQTLHLRPISGSLVCETVLSNQSYSGLLGALQRRLMENKCMCEAYQQGVAVSGGGGYSIST